jgi:hypothetical protein
MFLMPHLNCIGIIHKAGVEKKHRPIGGDFLLLWQFLARIEKPPHNRPVLCSKSTIADEAGPRGIGGCFRHKIEHGACHLLRTGRTI